MLVVRHEDFKNPDDSYIELHGVKRYWKVSQEGHPDYFFDAITPTDENNKPFDDLGKTVGTLLQLTEPVWGSGRVFVLDSGFCVLQAIVELRKKGLFAAALIKKRRYWPKYIPGESILAHFAEKGIGELDALQGMLDDVKFHVVAMKEPDYVMMFMTTYGTLAPVGEEKKRHYLVNGVNMSRHFDIRKWCTTTTSIEMSLITITVQECTQ